VEQLSNLELELWTQVNLMIFYQIYFLPKYKIVKLKKKAKRSLGEWVWWPSVPEPSLKK
jgi:hypothetical protein